MLLVIRWCADDARAEGGPERGLGGIVLVHGVGGGDDGGRGPCCARHVVVLLCILFSFSPVIVFVCVILVLVRMQLGWIPDPGGSDGHAGLLALADLPEAERVGDERLGEVLGAWGGDHTLVGVVGGGGLCGLGSVGRADLLVGGGVSCGGC